MFQQIIVICLGLVATVHLSPMREREVSGLIALLKQPQLNDEFSILSTLIKVNEESVGVELFELIKKEFNQYKEKYNKVYESKQEEEARLKSFFIDIIAVKTHNEQYKKGEKTFRMEINHMSDWTIEEYDRLNGLTHSKVNGSSYVSLNHNANVNVTLPSSVDWRDNGAVTPVKSQGNCGSCYSFSSTGALEAQIWRKTGKLVSLSEQQIVDCDPDTFGCDGGEMTNVFSYIKKVGGVMSEQEYPYISGTTQHPNKKCRFVKSETMATDSGFVELPLDEMLIQEAVATRGPVSIGMHASKELKSYKSGIFYDAECVRGPVNHALLIVGYGTDKESGTPYWIIKNSWGTTWGEDGYLRMPRNVNACNMASQAVFPLV